MPDAASSERVSVWIYDWRDEDGNNPRSLVNAPIFFLARVAPDGTPTRVRNIWCVWFNEADEVNASSTPVLTTLQDREFVRRAVAEGRIQRIGPVPELPSDSPHNERLRSYT